MARACQSKNIRLFEKLVGGVWQAVLRRCVGLAKGFFAMGEAALSCVAGGGQRQRPGHCGRGCGVQSGAFNRSLRRWLRKRSALLTNAS